MSGILYIVGIGPGDGLQMTFAAKNAIEDSDTIVGYKTYVNLLGDMIDGKELVTTGMTKEIDRAKEAIKLAGGGRKVAVVSSGDAGIYGMAGLIFELLAGDGWKKGDALKVEVIPGITALSSASSLLGAPLMHDFAVISLSDLLTPWELIVKRINAAAKADFVIALYNPASKKRVGQIKEFREILLKERDAKTPVGLVKNCYREGQEVIVTTLDEMLDHEIAMTTTVIIGNSETFSLDDLMITPRGYSGFTSYSGNQLGE